MVARVSDIVFRTNHHIVTWDNSRLRYLYEEGIVVRLILLAARPNFCHKFKGESRTKLEARFRQVRERGNRLLDVCIHLEQIVSITICQPTTCESTTPYCIVYSDNISGKNDGNYPNTCFWRLLRVLLVHILAEYNERLSKGGRTCFVGTQLGGTTEIVVGGSV